jgi:hypothetical protein
MSKNRMNFFTHHKCASTWLGNLVARICELNGLSCYHSHHGTAVPSEEHDLSLLTNSDYATVSAQLRAPSFHIIRNPLSIISSAYFSHLNTHPTDGWVVLEKQRRILNSQDRATGMLLTLGFLEAAEFYPSTPGPLHALRCWNFDDERIVTLRMEDIVADVGAFLDTIRGRADSEGLLLPPPDEFGFEKFTGRRIGEVNDASHYRSGDADSWRRDLPPAIVDYVWAHFSPLMERYYPGARPA